MSTEAYLVLAALLFAVGALGFLLRRNAIIAVMSVELMLNAANLVFVIFARQHGKLDGQVASFFVMVVAAAEVVVIALNLERFSFIIIGPVMCVFID